MKKKFLSVLVAGVLCTTLVPATAFAANTETTEPNASTKQVRQTESEAHTSTLLLTEEDANGMGIIEEDASHGPGEGNPSPETPHFPDDSEIIETPGAESGPPEAAENLTAEAVSYNAVNLTWDAANKASKYVVYRSTSIYGSYSKIATVTDEEAYLDGDLKMGTTYYYKVLSFNGNERGDYSNTVSAKPILEQPQNVAAIRTSSTAVQLSWNEVEGATKYVIYRSTSEDGRYSKIDTATLKGRFNDTKLEEDTTYYYKVLPFHEHTRGIFSDVAVTKDKLDELTGLEAVSLEDGTILVSWEETPGASQYKVYRSTTEKGKYSLVSTMDHLIAFTDEDIKLGATYYYKVAPVCGSIEGDMQGPVSAIASHSEIVDSVLEVGRSLIGTPYVYGGKTPAGFDCSGYVWYTLNQAGYKTGYRTSSQWRSTSYPTYYKMSDAQPGDILCFDGHVGIYAGNGIMIDSGRGGVRETSLSLAYWKNTFRCVKRIF